MKRIALLLLAVNTMITFGQFEKDQLTGEEKEEQKRVRLGADFAMQYQILDHHGDSLIPLGKGFNLPTANLNLEATLAEGIEVSLTTYLSSRHHPEAWVKGGYLIIDELPFFKSEGVDRVMDYLTLKVGNMEINYGDAHFRRSDNGHVIRNPFVGNYIMDAFTTAFAAELMFRTDGWLAMGALSNGTLRPDLVRYNAGSQVYTAYNTTDELAYYWKLGYDNQFSDDLRLRLTVSGYHNPKHHFGSLYNAERAGSRYYLVMNRMNNSPNDVNIEMNHTSGNYGPGPTSQNNSIMLNLFGKFMGFEIFGTYEYMKGKSLGNSGLRFDQYAIEGLYRFGKEEQFYGGLRYNLVKNSNDQTVNRLQIGAGWFILESIVLKVEYVDQNYNEFQSTFGADAGFDGLMVEAAVSF